MKKILIMGLPGSGKTTLAINLVGVIERAGHSVTHLNADSLREQHNDWDFTYDGRIRQAQRMADYADMWDDDYVIMDFVCPFPEMRAMVKPDYLIFMDTIQKSEYEDTNALFDPPSKGSYDLKIKSFKSADAETIWKTNLISL